MIVLMHTFSERLPVKSCRGILHSVNPSELIEFLEFLPIEKASVKKGRIEITYIHNPNARFGGKAKTKVTVTSGENTLRLHGLGPLSFELRLSCTAPTRLLVYLTVTGKLIDKVPRDKVRELFNRLLLRLRSMAGEAAPSEEKPAPAPQVQPAAAAAPPPAAPSAATHYVAPPPTAAAPNPAALRPAAPLPTGMPLAANPANPPAYAPAHGQPVAAPQPPQPQPAVPPPAAAAPPPPAAAGAGQAPNPAMCMVRMITAGFPIDEELSRRVPSEYSPRLRGLPLAAHGYEEATRVNLVEYDDADYLIRLVSGDTRVDVARVGGRVGVYYRGPRGEAYGAEAARMAVGDLCRPGRRVAYTVARLS